MSKLRSLILASFLLPLSGCSRLDSPTWAPGDPMAVEALRAHWEALNRGDWKAAHARLHPDLRAGITIRKFGDFHNRRRKLAALPQAIEVVGSESSDDQVVVSFDALYTPPGGGAPVAVPPRRKVALRKSGDSWNLMTHDVLAIKP
jgi:hypothetical protein